MPIGAPVVFPKVLDFNDKRLHWASVVRVAGHKNKTNLLLVDQTLLGMAVYKKKPNSIEHKTTMEKYTIFHYE
jgi:hypothetical protein